METLEHTEVGDQIQYFSEIQNPYICKDAQGVLCLTLIGNQDGALTPLPHLKLSAGQIVAMAGDYFANPGWEMVFDIPNQHSNANHIELARKLIKDPVRREETEACQKSFAELANAGVRPCDIQAIYNIKETTYLPIDTLNGYFQELMLYLRVANYGKKVDKNAAHFTPWAIRAYLIGHQLALRQARIAYELEVLANNPDYISNNKDAIPILRSYIEKPDFKDNIEAYRPEMIELAHRYHALATATELSTFHYYSDCFASGHLSRMGFLRNELPDHFGSILGGLLVNDMHNEDNRVGVNVSDAYDPHPENWYHTTAYGDRYEDNPHNFINKANCIKGMSLSLAEIEAVRAGQFIPQQPFYRGFEELPEVDESLCQKEPLFILWESKIYRRKHPSKIKILSPSEYKTLMSTDPEQHGYIRVKSKWDAFKQVFKLRILAPFYQGKVQKLSAETEARIDQEELEKNPHRDKDGQHNHRYCPKHKSKRMKKYSREGLAVTEAPLREYIREHGFFSPPRKPPKPSEMVATCDWKI